MRGLTGAGASGVAAVAFLVATEPVGPTWRGAASAAAFAISGKGAALLPALGWLLPYWRGETFAAAAVTAAFLLCLLPSVPESPRWLLHRGRKASMHSVLLERDPIPSSHFVPAMGARVGVVAAALRAHGSSVNNLYSCCAYHVGASVAAAWQAQGGICFYAVLPPTMLCQMRCLRSTWEISTFESGPSWLAHATGRRDGGACGHSIAQPQPPAGCAAGRWLRSGRRAARPGRHPGQRAAAAAHGAAAAGLAVPVAGVARALTVSGVPSCHLPVPQQKLSG